MVLFLGSWSIHIGIVCGAAMLKNFALNYAFKVAAHLLMISNLLCPAWFKFFQIYWQKILNFI